MSSNDFELDVSPKKKDFVMPFGKYKGEVLEDIPNSYLEWALENMTHIDDEMKEAIKTRLILGSYVKDDYGR